MKFIKDSCQPFTENHLLLVTSSTSPSKITIQIAQTFRQLHTCQHGRKLTTAQGRGLEVQEASAVGMGCSSAQGAVVLLAQVGRQVVPPVGALEEAAAVNINMKAVPGQHVCARQQHTCYQHGGSG
jgi:ABC-type enterochelin transport system substrate-binding protein